MWIYFAVLLQDEDGNNFLRISVAPNRRISCVVFFGDRPLNFRNLERLVGLPETYLNLLDRWHNGLIVNLFEFLGQEQSSLIYYDQYERFQRFPCRCCTLPLFHSIIPLQGAEIKNCPAKRCTAVVGRSHGHSVCVWTRGTD